MEPCGYKWRATALRAKPEITYTATHKVRGFEPLFHLFVAGDGRLERSP